MRQPWHILWATQIMLKDEGSSWQFPDYHWGLGSLSKGNSNRDIVWCFAQQCWHQVANEPCFLGGQQMCVLRFTTSRTKVMPSCLPVLFWCPPPVNQVCGGQIAGSRELPREAKLLILLYFPFLRTHLNHPTPEKPPPDSFFANPSKKDKTFDTVHISIEEKW